MTILRFQVVVYEFQGANSPINGTLVEFSLVCLGVIVLRTAAGYHAFKWLGDLVTRFLDFSDAGARFVFGERFTHRSSMSIAKNLCSSGQSSCEQRRA